MGPGTRLVPSRPAPAGTRRGLSLLARKRGRLCSRTSRSVSRAPIAVALARPVPTGSRRCRLLMTIPKFSLAKRDHRARHHRSGCPGHGRFGDKHAPDTATSAVVKGPNKCPPAWRSAGADRCCRSMQWRGRLAAALTPSSTRSTSGWARDDKPGHAQAQPPRHPSGTLPRSSRPSRRSCHPRCSRVRWPDTASPAANAPCRRPGCLVGDSKQRVHRRRVEGGWDTGTAGSLSAAWVSSLRTRRWTRHCVRRHSAGRSALRTPDTPNTPRCGARRLLPRRTRIVGAPAGGPEAASTRLGVRRGDARPRMQRDASARARQGCGSLPSGR